MSLQAPPSMAPTSATQDGGSSSSAPPTVIPDARMLVIEDDAFMLMSIKLMLSSIADLCNHPEDSASKSPPSPGVVARPKLHVEFCSSGEAGWDLPLALLSEDGCGPHLEPNRNVLLKISSGICLVVHMDSQTQLSFTVVASFRG